MWSNNLHHFRHVRNVFVEVLDEDEDTIRIITSLLHGEHKKLGIVEKPGGFAVGLRDVVFTVIRGNERNIIDFNVEARDDGIVDSLIEVSIQSAHSFVDSDILPELGGVVIAQEASFLVLYDYQHDGIDLKSEGRRNRIITA